MLVIDGLSGVLEIIKDEKRKSWIERERLLNKASNDGRDPVAGERATKRGDARYLEGRIHMANTLLAYLEDAVLKVDGHGTEEGSDERA